MRLLFTFFLLAIQATPLAAQQPRSDAYLDPGARELVRQARERQAAVGAEIRGYQALVQERASVKLRALGRDRDLASMQTAARVDWQRAGPVRVQVVGSRTVDPEGEQVMSPGDRSAASFAYNPADDPLRIRLSDSTWVRHPLAPGSEQYYRFHTGRANSIQLAGSRTVRLIELVVEPREEDFRLLRGSVWLDAETHDVVRILFRPASRLTASLFGGVSTKGKQRSINLGAKIGGGSGGLLDLSAEAEVRYVTVEYSLHEGRWWMLRSLAFDGVGRLGSLAALPVRWERAYSEYRIDGVESPLPPLALADTATVNTPGSACPTEGKHACRCVEGTCRVVEVEVPTDTAALLASADLPPPLDATGGNTLSGTDIDEITRELKRHVPPLWALAQPRLDWTPPGIGTLRYNRVEGLSAGAGLEADFGALSATASVRLGLADLEPNGELALLRETGTAVYRLGGYRRLATVDPATRGLGSSLSALLWARDDAEYFRAAGVELSGVPALAERPWYAWRLYAERQTEANKHTDFSLLGLVDDGRDFRPVIEADRADQLGGSLILRGARGSNPLRPRAWTELFTEGATGTYDFVRPSLLAAGIVPLGGSLAGSLEVEAGSSLGTVPTQALWYLGGPATLRGYDGSAARGEAFWRSRAELAKVSPPLELAVFSDAGWAGARGSFGGDPLVSAGVGIGFFDGWLRLDLARALVAPTGWRLDLYLDTGR